jgi:glycerol-3-phosphate O-acyltransferase
MYPKDKQKVLVEVQSRVKERVLAQARASDEAFLDNLIHEVFYFEEERIRHHGYKSKRKADRAWVGELRGRFHNASEQEKKRILGDIIDRHAGEVIGHFSESVYRFSTSVLPIGLGFMLNAFSPLKLIRTLPKLPDVARNVIIQGEVDQLRKLQKIGTCVLAPTHLSNLDSPLMGYAVYRMGLPPVTYGAGLNLFEHRFMGYFMNRLGAYKVDRLKKHSIYKEVLKEYAVATLEHGYDNLFFPGGTRSRSGAVERKLKLGLLGAGIHAYFNNIKNKKADPKIFIIPCTLNYQLVLEAENLIEDHLKEAGKSRYIIMDDEFSMPGRIYTFLRNLVSLDERICLTISGALDPFGNEVNDDGQSIDGRGRSIDGSRYFLRKGKLCRDFKRDAEFTRELGRKVVDSYMRDTVVFSTHLLAWTVFEKLRRLAPDADFYRFLRSGADGISLPMVEVYQDVEKTLSQVRVLADSGRIKLSESEAQDKTQAVVDRALALFGCYHTKPVVQRRGDRLFPMDMNLLYYYRNRLWGYGLERNLKLVVGMNS